jgi:hypothetical protein
MVKTTVYLENNLALTVRQLALLEGRSQAELIRNALAAYAKHQNLRPIPGIGEFDSGAKDVSDRAEDILRKASRKKWRRKKSRGLNR